MKMNMTMVMITMRMMTMWTIMTMTMTMMTMTATPLRVTIEGAVLRPWLRPEFLRCVYSASQTTLHSQRLLYVAEKILWSLLCFTDNNTALDVWQSYKKTEIFSVTWTAHLFCIYVMPQSYKKQTFFMHSTHNHVISWIPTTNKSKTHSQGSASKTYSKNV